MTRSDFVLLTGAIGGGKTTVLSRLKEMGVACVAEPAREILTEQRLIGGTGIPEVNPEMFCMLMLSRSIQNYKENIAASSMVIFDRGIPDMVAYAELFGLNSTPYRNAAMEFRYAARVFHFAGWEEIYTTDEERKIGFEGANAFGLATRSICEALGYSVLEVPQISIEDRVKFILDGI